MICPCNFYYKNPSLKGDEGIHEVHDLNNVYISAIFYDHHTNYSMSLEDIFNFYLFQFYQPGQTAKLSCHSTQNTLSFDWFSVQNIGFANDKLSAILWSSSGLMATQGAVTYIVTKGHHAHSLVEWLP